MAFVPTVGGFLPEGVPRRLDHTVEIRAVLQCLPIGKVSFFTYGSAKDQKTHEGQMSRTLRAAILLLFLASCGGSNFTAPHHLDDACSVIQQRPQYLAAMRVAQSNWGVPISVQMAILYQESKFIGNARTPHQYALGVIPMGRQSSAYGYAQALDSTWDDYRKERNNLGARRDNIRDATDFVGWYINGTTASLGISKGDAENQYLAYHEGRNGFSNKSYQSKRWLVDVAHRLGKRADLYHTQLQTCLH